jgi:hypothetical protein
MRCAWGLALAAAALLAAAPAAAYIPPADRVEAAVAANNQKESRNQALRIELSLRIGDGPKVAEGELVTHPNGLARLELRGAGGLVERHVLQGSEHIASRNGRLLDDPRDFLPPLFLLQADSGVTLRAALGTFGVRSDLIGLAPCGASDCFVVGDPSRVPPPPGSAAPAAASPAKRERGDAGAEPVARLWIDTVSYEVLRIDSARGVQVRLGPTADFEQVRFPSWIAIQEPGRSAARLDVLRVTPVNAPASAFGNAWLFGDGAPAPPPSAP